ncbi:glycoside hydrolase family 26 protein [Streptomyces lavendulocolor]|uniref:glycoside hydrolase family 26 protein n=1 Tax=Streptomyces lavendulocolor TaxID=67316 RepID=UPI003C2E3507
MGHRRKRTDGARPGGARAGALTAGLLGLLMAGSVVSAPAGHASAAVPVTGAARGPVTGPVTGAHTGTGPGPDGDREAGAVAGPGAGAPGSGAADGTGAGAGTALGAGARDGTTGGTDGAADGTGAGTGAGTGTGAGSGAGAVAETDTGGGPGPGSGAERVGEPGADPTPEGGTGDGAGAAATAMGAYLDYGPRGIHRMAGLSKWLGGADLRVGHTYLPGDVWTNIEGRPGFLEHWAQWRQARKDRLFVLNVPMLERNESHLPDPVVRQLLRLGADGRFDRHFRALAERLVRLDVPDTVLVLGWEMNGTTYSHRCGPDPEAWKAYWKRIVTTMRDVPGQRFRFDFAPNRGRDAVPWTECYPGDDVVDIIGMDSYDQPTGQSFDEQVTEPYGLRHHVEFAAAHGKPVSYPEWGLFRNGDNPEYMRRMLDWIERSKPLYHTITDYCPHGVWQCEENPRSSEVFRTKLSGKGGPVEPAPEPEPEPRPEPEPEPEPQPEEPACTPLDLGEWVEKWLGRKLCVRLEWQRRLTS